MTCFGVRIDPKAIPSLDNDALTLRYLAACVTPDGELLYPIEAIDKMVKHRFGSHLSIKYTDPKTLEIYDEPCGHFVLTVVSDSYFFSKELQ